MKKKKRTTTNQTTSLVTTPTNPTFVTQGIEDLSGKINSTFAGMDPKTFVQGPNALMNQGADAASKLATPSAYGGAEGMFRTAGGAGPQHVEAASLLDGLDKYFNPYQKNVIDTSLADFDYGAGQLRAQDMLDLGADSTFGGSSGAIKRSLTDDSLARGRGALSAGLYKSGFDTAAGLSGQDADRRQAAGMSNAGFGESALQRQLQAGAGLTDLGTAQGNDARANIGAQISAGNTLRVAQNEANAGPVDLLMKQISAFAGLPLDLLKGMSTNGKLDEVVKSVSSGMSLAEAAKIVAGIAASVATGNPGPLIAAAGSGG